MVGKYKAPLVEASGRQGRSDWFGIAARYTIDSPADVHASPPEVVRTILQRAVPESMYYRQAISRCSIACATAAFSLVPSTGLTK